MNLDKPKFLPFESLPISREQALQAGEYIYSLAVQDDSLTNENVYEIITGNQLGADRSLDQIRIAREVFKVIASVAPRTNKKNPSKVLCALERA